MGSQLPFESLSIVQAGGSAAALRPGAAHRRRRGGQPGNLNAMKHGFYSRFFRAGEVEDLETVLQEGLSHEIAMLRVITRRVMELADGVETLDEAIAAMGALGLASIRLSSLLKAQARLGSGGNDLAAAISSALSELMQEKGLR